MPRPLAAAGRTMVEIVRFVGVNRAANLRARASEVRHAPTKEQLMVVAARWEDMAAELERAQRILRTDEDEGP